MVENAENSLLEGQESKGTTSPNVGSTTTDVFSDVPKELRFSKEGNDKLERFKGKPSELAKSYIELESSMSSRVKIPDEKTNDEEKRAFYAKLGCPEKPEGYEVVIPEGTPVDEDFVTAMKAAAHKRGMSQEHFKGIVEDYLAYANEELAAGRAEGEKILKDEWKGDYDKNIEITQRAYREYGDKELFDLMKNIGMGNHPAMVKFVHKIGLAMLDDTMVRPEGAKQAGGNEEAGWKPTHINSPEMYRNDDSEEGRKSRAWFERNKGYKY